MEQKKTGSQMVVKASSSDFGSFHAEMELIFQQPNIA